MRILTAKATVYGIAAAFFGLILSQSANAEYLYNTSWETMVTPTMYLETAPTIGCNHTVNSPLVLDRSRLNNSSLPTMFRTVTQPVIVTDTDRYHLLNRKLY
jgi:hypothetical protein